jgi:hypothetical protein
MFASWIDNGTPVAAWLPGFFFTQSFLTAVLQNFARKYKLAVDSLKFSYKVLADVPATKPEDGCCIHGLYLDGGRWNANHQCLADRLPKVGFSVCRHTRPWCQLQVLFEPLPATLMMPVTAQDDGESGGSSAGFILNG